MTVMDIIAEPIDIDRAWKTRQEREKIVLDTMQEVGLDPSSANRYPHEFSGGQRQRIGIARAIIQRPKVVICDEPVSALDVSIQAKIINLLREIQQRQNISYIFISHDLGEVEHIANRIMVMYLGHVVEEGRKDDIFVHPAHPYTRLLLNSIPKIGKKPDDESVLLEGDLPSPANPPSGCVFHTRCHYAQARCSQDSPHLQTMDGIHKCACFVHAVSD